MSTQAEVRIPLTLVAEADRLHLRLLELPPELLSILTSADPPKLEFKSSEKNATDAGHAVLCTPDRTFNLRQKNSSNTVYLLQAAIDDDNPMPALEAVSQVYSSLELTAQKSAEMDATAYMRAILPIYSSTGVAAAYKVDQRSLFDQMPFSESQCTTSYKDLAAFELLDSDQVFRPSAALALQVWSSVLNAAVAEGVDLTASPDAVAVAAILSQDIATHVPIARAILDALSSDEDTCMAMLDSHKCVRWTGSTLLEAEASHSEMSTHAFVEKWKDLLPEKWRMLAEVSVLHGISQANDNGKSITFAGPVLVTDSAMGPQPGAGSHNAAAGVKRKWHEKFRPSKR